MHTDILMRRPGLGWGGALFGLPAAGSPASSGVLISGLRCLRAALVSGLRLSSGLRFDSEPSFVSGPARRFGFKAAIRGT
jgi:hypothetical protein